MTESMAVGVCGGRVIRSSGWTYVPKGDEISTTIHITYDEEQLQGHPLGNDAIFSISFVNLYENGRREEHEFGAGGGKGKKHATIELNGKIEKLRGISGTIGIFETLTVITSLRFITDDNKSYGPFGSVRGVSFSLHAGHDRVISGFCGRSGWWLDNIGVYIKPAKLAPKPATNIGAGPWGSPELGQVWTYEPKNSISHVSINYDHVCIYSIRFWSQDMNGNVEQSNLFGKMAVKSAEISIDINKEKLNKITGTYYPINGKIVVTSLSIATDKKRVFGPYGEEKGTSFSFEVDNDEFIGFHGRCESYLHAIGVYLLSKTQIVVGQWGSQEPGNEWSYAPKGLISEISITHDDAIYSISFTSEDDNGNVEHSEKFGSKTGSKSDKIQIDIKNEKLNFISGTVRVRNGFKVVTSISFKTDKNKAYGPFGIVYGTPFSLPVTNGYISGFHGRAGVLLDAIGVYVNPT